MAGEGGEAALHGLYSEASAMGAVMNRRPRGGGDGRRGSVEEENGEIGTISGGMDLGRKVDPTRYPRLFLMVCF